MRRLFTVVAIYASFTNVNAQVRLGPEVGINASCYTPTHMRWGVRSLRAGMQADITIKGHFDMLAGLFYVGEPLGSYGLFDKARPVMRLHCVELPLNIVYKAHVRGATTYIGAGVYGGVNITGETVLPPKGSFYIYPVVRKVKIGISGYDDIMPFDGGVSVTCGIMYRSGIYARLLFQHGLMNMNPGEGDYPFTRRYNYGLSIGYLFGNKHAKPQKKPEQTNG